MQWIDVGSIRRGRACAQKKTGSVMPALLQDGQAVFEAHRALLAQNLVVARSAAGLTQHVLARRSRVSRATIAQIEAGTGDPRFSTITMLAGALRISASQLLLGRSEMQALRRLVQGDPALSLFKALEVPDRMYVSIDIADRARNLATSASAAVGAALGASTLQPNGAPIGAALAYLIERGDRASIA